MNPQEIVQMQLDFYNKHNLEGFMSTYHDDITVYNLIDNSVILEGKELLREKYYERFEILKVHAELVNRMVIGNKVIDHEYVTELNVDEIVKAVAIYEIEDSLIKRVWFLFE
ncbi:nuclear transport factor 2 family protein [Tepidibacter aestuarii]|uniref:nuclear transport factor 2 family protein n=1 Tax=Tepidibacter aestuarii TaxID=2925782 RepID=UPI0020BD75F6|nr:nuclear transport factor 2 family protein [Tepidibacter aestuarii]CAH2211774.1 SnoaL-like domain-containing protein [Tepidibacter aestuarii]